MKSGAGFAPWPRSPLLAACIKPSFSVPRPKDKVYCTDVVLAREGEDRLLLHLNRQVEEKFRLAPSLQPMPDLCMDGKSWFVKRLRRQDIFDIVNKSPARPALQPNPACRAFPTPPLLQHCAMVGFRWVSGQLTGGEGDPGPHASCPRFSIQRFSTHRNPSGLFFFKAKTLILHTVRRRSSATCRDGVKCCLRSRKTSPWHVLQALL